MPKIITKTGTPRSSDAATYVVGVTRPTASYIYLADGTKVQAIGETGQGYEYVGSYSCTFSRLGIARASTALPSAYRKGSLRLSVNGSSVDIESIPFAGGRIVKTSNGYEPQYYITDHLGSTRTVVKPNATVVAEFDYMPYGTQHSVAGAPITEADYKYTGKEQQSAFGLDNLYDSQARFQYVRDGMFLSHDDLAEQFPWLSPYNYCAGNPINRIDATGKWDVTVHVYHDRAKYGYGIAIVTNRSGEEVYRFHVRAEGVKGHNRYKPGSDTPLGCYDIPDNYPWISGGNRSAYGPYPRLNMVGLYGEIVFTNRSLIRIHGGRQEIYNQNTNKWEEIENPTLKKTEGCIRAYDEDMLEFKRIVNQLTKQDNDEIPGYVTVIDDLQEIELRNNYVEQDYVTTIYDVPEDEFTYWKKTVPSFFKIY